MQPEFIGMTWFHRKDYKKLRQLFIDGDKFPLLYDQWLKKAEKGFNEIRRRGSTVEKVYFDPETFPAWCNERAMDIDARARSAFINEFMARKHVYND